MIGFMIGKDDISCSSVIEFRMLTKFANNTDDYLCVFVLLEGKCKRLISLFWLLLWRHWHL